MRVMAVVFSLLLVIVGPLGRVGGVAAAAVPAAREAQTSDASQPARAVLAACMRAQSPEALTALLERAMHEAQAAIAKDPHAAAPRLQMALVLGIKGRRVSVAQAVAGRFAPRGRRLIEEAIASDASEPFAHALLGAWHLEVLRRGGRRGAVFYRASLREGRAAFDRARALAPDDATIALMYAVSLLELDPQRDPTFISMLLRDAAEASGTSPLDRDARAVAAALLATLNAQGAVAAAASSARRFR